MIDGLSYLSIGPRIGAAFHSPSFERDAQEESAESTEHQVQRDKIHHPSIPEIPVQLPRLRHRSPKQTRASSPVSNTKDCAFS